MKFLNKDHSEKGMTILEMVLALFVGMMVVGILASLITQTSDMKEKIQVFESVQGIEQKIVSAVRSRKNQKNGYSLLVATKAQNPELARCLDKDASLCTSSWQPLGLNYVRGELIDGHYNDRGRRCSKSEKCPIKVATSFRAACTKAPCPPVTAIYVAYDIEVDGYKSRSGIVTHVIEQGKGAVGDDNETCGVDSDGRAKFARIIRSGKLTCEDSLKPIVNISGIQPGSCVRGKEVIVGVAADGKIICEAAKFKK